MPVPNPYFIYIELLWPDGHRATQNEIARVKATDVNGAQQTDEGQSGWDPNTGGWQPIFMQNIAIFQSRGAPNLRFDVISTQEVNVYSTQVFNNIASGSTVRIIIGQSATIVGGGTGPTTFTLTGHARKLSNSSAFFPGNVQISDITNGSEALIGNTILAADGSYSLSFTSDQFTNNGVSHVQPNLKVRLFDPITGQLLTESDLVIGWVTGQTIDLTVDDSVPPPREHKVFGNVTNGLGLPVANVQVQAFDVIWSTAGIQEILLGSTVSKSDGSYEIIYQPPNPTTTPNACAPSADQINLLVKAVTPAVTSPPTSPPTFNILATEGVIFNAAQEQRADLVVNKAAVSGLSEYTALHNALSGCLGATDSERFATMNQLNTRPDLLTFVSQSSGQDEAHVQAYINAWLIALEISTKVPSVPASPPTSPPGTVLFHLLLPSVLPPGSTYGGSPEVMYALVRDGLGTSLTDLLSVDPDAFFDSVVEAIHQSIISANIEPRLRPTGTTTKDSLVDDWRTVLAKMLTRAPASNEATVWQSQLLSLAFPDPSPALSGTIGTATLNSDTAQNHNVTMPSTVVAGDLLLVLLTTHNTAVLTGTPAGWNILSSLQNTASGANIRFTVFAKIGAASDANQVISFTNIAGNSAAQVVRIAQGTWSGALSDVAVNAVANNLSANNAMDPPLATWPWAFGVNAGTLFFACGAISGTATVTQSPSSYSTALLTFSGLTCSTISSQRVLFDSSENPNPFTLSANSFWVAATIAIKPGISSSQAAKREAVAKAHFDSQGSFDDLIALLKISTNPAFTALDLENLRFVFEMYDKVDRYYPIVAVVFIAKASKTWHTIADLATLVLADWLVFAQRQATVPQPFPPPGGFPGDIPGNTAADKASVYAQRLLDLFGGLSPQNRFVTGMAQSPVIPGFTQLAAFLTANPTFSLESSNIDVFNATATQSPPTSPLTTPLPAALVPSMKQLQRVYRLTNDVAAATALINNGFDSAVKISQTEEGAFIASQEQFVGGLTAARNIHRTASTYTNEVVNNVVRFHQNLTDVGGMTAVQGAPNFTVMATPATISPTEGFITNLGNIASPFSPDPRKLPNWTTLFGNLNSCACKCCQTVLSPGAYLTDIIEFATKGARKPLLDRRPDLQDLVLNCPNTFTTLPYIDLVNEVLESAVAPLTFSLTMIGSPPSAISASVIDAAVNGISTADSQVRQAFADHGYILGKTAVIRRSAEDKNVASPPVSPPSQRVWVVEDDDWQHTIRGFTAPFSVNPVPQTGVTNDTLEVFPEHINTAAYNTLAAAVFPFNLPLSLGKEEANLLLQAKGVRQHEILEAFTVDSRDTAFAKGTGALGFLNLSTSEAAAIIAAPLGGPTYWGFADESVTQIPRPDQPTQTLTGTWMDLLTLMPVFLHRSGLTYQEVLDLLDTAFIQKDALAAGKILHIAASPDGKALLECDFNQFQIAHLNDAVAGRPTLRRMSFFIRLWRKLGWTMRDLDTYLMSLEGGAIPANLNQVSLVKRMIDQLQLEPRQVFAFWSNIDNRRSDRNKKSLYDDTFLIGTPDQPELVDLETVARGGSVPLAGTAPASAGEDLRNHVRAGLNLKAAEIDLLWPTAGLVTVPVLSQIYRIATFSHAAGISVVDYFDFLALTGTDPFAAIPSSPPLGVLAQVIKAFDALADIGRAQSTSMVPGEIQYYLTDFSDAGDPFVAKREDLNTAAQRLVLSVGEISASLPSLPHPDATSLSQLLAKILPADKVVRAVTIITPVFPLVGSPPAPSTVPLAPSAPDIAFLKRYFAPFISAPPGPDAFLTKLFAETDEPSRFKMVFDQANDYLVDQAQRTAVVNITSELFSTDKDTVDLLLTDSLSSTRGRPTAMDDWKALLGGGWDNGTTTPDLTIENLAGPRTWNGVIVIPKGGDYRFVVSIGAFGVTTPNFTLSIDDGTTATVGFPKNPLIIAPASPPASPPDPVTQFMYDPVSLKGGTVVNVTFSYNGAASPAIPVSLLWRIDNADPVVIPATVVIPTKIFAPLKAASGSASPPAQQLAPVAPPEYLKMFKATRMVTGLSLTKAELRYLIQVQPPLPASPPNPQALVFSLDKLPVLATDPDIAWKDLATVIDLLGLNRAIAFKDKTLFEFWNDVAAPTIDDVSNQTGWKVEDIAAVQTLWLISSPPLAVPSFRDPAIWYVLRQTMDIVNRLDLRARRIMDFLVLAEPTAQTIGALRNSFRSQFTLKEWKDVFKPLRDPLRQKQRDALVGYLTTRPITYNGRSVSFFDANDLYGFFLIDVQMEPDTLISRMVLAHLIVQLFVDRVFLGLEDPASFPNIDDAKDQWSWMSRFRVWEANRKVFLYPENYIEPELRDDKTPFFQELEDELLQGDVSNDTGITALANYIDKLNEASNLEIIGSYAQPGSPGVNFTLHVVGRTRGEPRAHYYRSFTGKQTADGTWTPWINIPIDIKADVVAPVIFNGRLHLYWPAIKIKERPDPPKEDAGNNQTKPKFINGDNVADEHYTTYLAEIKLMSTEYVAGQNKWIKPKVSKERALDQDAPTPFTNEVGEAIPPTANYHLRVSQVGKEFVSIDLIKTHTPEPPKERVIPGATTIVGFSGRGFQIRRTPERIEEIPQDQISPQRLGAFQFWYTGQDTFQGDDKPPVLPLGKNWPVGTALTHNGAVQVTDISVEQRTVDNRLELAGNQPFFEKTPDTFRVFATNFGYLGSENQPFFYETARESLFALNKGPVTKAGLTTNKNLTANFATFNHPLVRQLQNMLHDFGPAALMSRLTEALPLVDNRYYANYYYNYYGNLYLGYHIAGDNQALGTIERMFEADFATQDTVVGAAARPTNEFAYGSSFGVYNWELFFHLPILIAERLKQNLKFEDALKWYHYVFDPKQGYNTYEQTRRFIGALPPGARFWTFLPFFANKDVTDSLLDTLGLKKTFSADDRQQLANIIDDWKHNPFKPHLIARQRIAAYQKFVVMRYLQNLIDWGDNLFRQDSFESINQATQLYVLADDILGDKPQEVSSLAPEKRSTVRELAAQGLDAFSNAIVEVEYSIVINQDYIKTNVLEPQNSASQPIRSIALKSFFFMIPRNDSLDTFWDTVDDRLFKIRNSMNIDGVKRALALFQPPINPALLVAAAAAGLDLSGVIAQLNTPLPHYRFSTWMQKAVDLAKELQSFAGEMLSAMEKKDGEALQLLRQNHDVKMQKLIRNVRQRQRDEADGNIAALDRQKAIAEDRRDEYHNRSRINVFEGTELLLSAVSTGIEAYQAAAHTLSGVFGSIPDGDVGMVGPFPLALSALKIGEALKHGAEASGNTLGVVASLTRGGASLAGMMATFERRWEDFKLQERQANKEIDQINQQIAVANIRLDIAEQELSNQETMIDQSEEVLDFLKTKFTNKDLYSFMVTQLSRTFQQVYKLAFDAAKTAERTLQFELGVEDSYIQFGYQDSLHQGLLAAEKLIHDLKRMEVGYLERDKREYEIQKPISLAIINGDALQTLRLTGKCDFELSETLFDLDFPGQYFRRVKSVRLTIPCVTGPHTSVSAKLTLLSSTFRKDANIDQPSKYPYKGPDDARFVQDPVGIQAIATSTGQNDAGLFELNFRDERYLPFEGAGVISRWRLELPTVSQQFDYGTISDVVMQLSYTARDGGGRLKSAAEGDIEKKLNNILKIVSDAPTGLVRSFSLRREFPDVLHKLLFPASPPTPVPMTIVPEHFPFVIVQRKLPIQTPTFSFRIDPKVGKAPIAATFTVGTNPDGTGTVGSPLVLPKTLYLQATGLTTPNDVDDIVVVVNYKVGAPPTS